MQVRELQEREVFDNGIVTEWGPSNVANVNGLDSNEARQVVRELNRKAKAEGSWTRYRSVAQNDWI